MSIRRPAVYYLLLRALSQQVLGLLGLGVCSGTLGQDLGGERRLLSVELVHLGGIEAGLLENLDLGDEDVLERVVFGALLLHVLLDLLVHPTHQSLSLTALGAET
eukprot:TRINITY_DN130003_c0_g1_i1.p2 TRINITY_DN130003_c0_g1~~TRINITY_DN130003_c0_g1_i1.p2  ORF type:complete len:105 (-),score=16.19 TRINITY_DN130003_c0_g1_i1:42-356(-)